MCYSAQIEADYRTFVCEFGAVVDMEAFTQLWLRDNNETRRPKTPGALDLSFLRPGDSNVAAIAAEIREWDKEEVAQLEIELTKQTDRLAAAKQRLATTLTKIAASEHRISGNKIEQIKRKIADLKRGNLEARDSRMFPGYYCPMLVSEGGKLVVRPMRYECRPGRSRCSMTKNISHVQRQTRQLGGLLEGWVRAHAQVATGRHLLRERGRRGRAESGGPVHPAQSGADAGGLLVVHWTAPKGQ